ncbi:hypothetical protein HDV00_007098 [Rhizophlyctis rosea]|nr:hypothetical protein HDV00_007098 [Rhizophlyctis rosea]
MQQPHATPALRLKILPFAPQGGAAFTYGLLLPIGDANLLSTVPQGCVPAFSVPSDNLLATNIASTATLFGYLGIGMKPSAPQPGEVCLVLLEVNSSIPEGFTMRDPLLPATEQQLTIQGQVGNLQGLVLRVTNPSNGVGQMVKSNPCLLVVGNTPGSQGLTISAEVHSMSVFQGGWSATRVATIGAGWSGSVVKTLGLANNTILAQVGAALDKMVTVRALIYAQKLATHLQVGLSLSALAGLGNDPLRLPNLIRRPDSPGSAKFVHLGRGIHKWGAAVNLFERFPADRARQLSNKIDALKLKARLNAEARRLRLYMVQPTDDPRRSRLLFDAPRPHLAEGKQLLVLLGFLGLEVNMDYARGALGIMGILPPSIPRRNHPQQTRPMIPPLSNQLVTGTGRNWGDRMYLRRALNREDDGDRLEFIGDAVLDAALMRTFFHRAVTAADLDQERSRVTNRSFSVLSVHLRLPNEGRRGFVPSRLVPNSPQWRKTVEKLNADLFEAMVGGAFLDEFCRLDGPLMAWIVRVNGW